MLREYTIDGKVFVEQTTFFVYESAAQRAKDKPAMTTSDEKLFEKYKRSLLIDFLKEKFGELVPHYKLVVKCGYDNRVGYIIYIQPDEEYENNDEVTQIMVEAEERFAAGTATMITFVSDMGNFEFDELFFELQ